ncbi:NAD-dependent epimerase/dehydratase family protein [Macrococcoides bohemicum]|uniref:NAD-dependent epimerase/dehydratase family protein n=1 Tax=Macrococcoides bohemicum TaxID=1903056 RepID=UPI00105A3A68|nr:NAD-dependent epimerase/dehydratase family protein [Macrococcus bohemicus]TDL37554.1 NAD-dependent epimerase/dehydratase family protein [Macrococcus bohemicus]
MKPRLLLTGATGYIGKNLYEYLKDDFEIYAMSKYPAEDSKEDMHWVTGDMFSLNDCIDALGQVDFGVYFLDPTKHSNKLNDATFQDINAISADNFARAAEATNLKAIIYVSGTGDDEETINILNSYKTPVQITKTPVKRKGIVAQTQNSKSNDVRSIQRTLMPSSWTVERVSKHYFAWLSDMALDLVEVKEHDGRFEIYGVKKHILTLEKDEDKSDDNRIVYNITGGVLHHAHVDSRARMEFRRLKGTDILIIALHDYEPTLPWLVYMLTEAPIYHLTMKIFDVEMRIERFQEEKEKGIEKKYTK